VRTFLVLLLSFILLSCTSNEFVFSEVVEAKVSGFTHKYIGLQYKIYGHQIFQDVKVDSQAEHAYYSAMKTIPLTVTVGGHDRDGGDYIYLTLTHKGTLFGEKHVPYDKLSITDFISKDVDIHNFRWTKYDNEEYDPPLTPQELRMKLKEGGEEAPEIKVILKEKKGEEKPI